MLVFFWFFGFVLLTLSMHERVVVVALSVCLSCSDFGDYWQLTVDLGMNLFRKKI